MPVRDAALRAIEAAHDGAGDDRVWLERIVGELGRAGLGPWVGYTVAGKRVDNFVGEFPIDVQLIRDAVTATPEAVIRAGHAPAPPVGDGPSKWGRVVRRFDMSIAELERLWRYPVPTNTALLGTDARGEGVFLAYRKQTVPPRTSATLHGLAAHLAAAYRLRRHVRQPVAIFAPDGRMLDGAHKPPERDSIAVAVRAMARARGKLRRLDPDEAVDAWDAMIDGQWSLVDREESDGKRLVLVHKNPPKPSIAALSGMEARVATFAALAHSDKYIAYELGLARSTVATHLRSALRKLRLRDRRALVALYGPLARAEK